MKQRKIRVFGAILLVIASGFFGYGLGMNAPRAGGILGAPPPDSVRVIYSLDKKQTDKELIALIDQAKTHIYFAVYTFTLEDVARALAAAKARGVDVKGIMDSGQGTKVFSAPVLEILAQVKIPVVTEKHPGGTGIMHLKMLVTDSAYAHGSYNWTNSATNINDEILEIGTDEALRTTHEALLKRLFDKYKDNPVSTTASTASGAIYDYTEAGEHVGEHASVRGVLVATYTSAKGTTFLNFCKNYKGCPFAGVVFSGDSKKFSDLESHVGSTVTLTGKIVSYQGQAEIILNSPSQLSKI